VAQIRHLKSFNDSFIGSGFLSNTDGHFCLLFRRQHGARLDYDSSTTHREPAVQSDPLVAVSETDLLVCVVPCEPSLLGHPVAPEDEFVQIGCYVYLMPYSPFAYRERNVSDSLDEHVLVVGSLNGLKLARPYLLMVLLSERAPGDGHIATGIDERLYWSSSILDNNAYGTRMLANRTDLASVKLLFLSIGELRACP